MDPPEEEEPVPLLLAPHRRAGWSGVCNEGENGGAGMQLARDRRAAVVHVSQR